jgi:hypothetical protein
MAQKIEMTRSDIAKGSCFKGVSKIGILSDSLLANIQIGSTRILRPDRERNTPLNKTFLVGRNRQELDIRQFSYSGLSAINANTDATKNRKILFEQLREAYPDKSDRPKVW